MLQRLAPAAFALVLLASAPLHAAPAAAQTSIVATVNGEPITSYDVSQRQRLLQISGEKGSLRDAALEELINEKVQMRAVKRSGMKVSEADVDRAIQNIATNVKLSPAQLATALGQAGINIDALRERIRVQIAFGQLVRALFQQSNEVSEQELVHVLRTDKEAKGEPVAIETEEYDLTQVIVAMPIPPTKEGLAKATQVADGLRATFTSCEEGLQKAKATRNVVVRSYGRRTASEMTPDTREALKETPVGHLAKPMPGPRGLVLFAVCDRKTLTSTNAAMKELEPDLTSKRGEAFLKSFTRKLRRDAVIERT